MMTDPVADMLTRVRNALLIERPFVDIPLSHLKKGIADALQREGYIWDYEVIEQAPQSVLRINLKYGPNGERVIQSLKRISSPGRRVFTRIKDSTDVRQGLGVTILSTSRGIMSNREARTQHIGGEVLCEVW